MMGRSILAIIAGFVTTVIVATVCDLIVVTVFPAGFSHDGAPIGTAMQAGALTYTFVSAVIGSYVTGLVAQRRPVWHALILGAIALLVTVPVMLKMRSVEPGWYVALAIIMVLPAAWLGGALRSRQSGAVAEAAPLL